MRQFKAYQSRLRFLQVICDFRKSFAIFANQKWRFKAYQCSLRFLQIVCDFRKPFAIFAISD